MTRVLVNIVSAQTVPNYLFIKEFQEEADLFLFISTSKMEEDDKTNIIWTTAGLDKKMVRKILINEDELYLAKSKLDKLGWKDAGYEFLVNITGGTKLMSNAVYAYFKNLNSRFFYLPIQKNVVSEIFEDKPATKQNIAYKISVMEYMSLYGIDYEKSPPLLDKHTVYETFQLYESAGYENFPYKKIKNIARDLKKGIWFEHWLYYRIKDALGIPDAAIELNIRMHQKGQNYNFADHLTDNEVDLAFVVNNKIFIVEAKVSLGQNRVKTIKLTNALYKLAAVNKRFGLNAKAVLLTLADFSTLTGDARISIEKRCELLAIPFPFEREILANDSLFEAKLKLIV